MKPIGRQIQDITRMQYHLSTHRLFKLCTSPILWIIPINRRMPYARMSLRIQRHLLALIRIRNNIPPFPAKHGDHIPRHVKVIHGRDTPHTEAAVDSPFLGGIDNVKFRLAVVFLRIEEGQFVVNEFTRRCWV